MKVPELPQNGSAEQDAARTGETPRESVSLYLRLWTYGGPSQPLNGLALEQEPEIVELIGSVIRDAKGVIPEPQPAKVFSAVFDDGLIAVAAAKALQQRFLTYHRNREPQQVVPCVLIAKTSKHASPGPDTASTDPEDLLGNVNSARILVGESIYELVKSAPGLRFSPTAVREGGQTGDPEAIYELLWTDESTYGHLRKAIHAHFSSVGRYQLQEEIGRGAMGTVYKAYDQLIGRTVALKTISIDRNTPERAELLERLKQEAKAAGKLDHANIITIYDVGDEAELLYLSMQFVEGKTLQSLLAESGVPPLATLISWADQILSALGYAHAHGVIHRDLKPANLMLTTEGVIKVLDFGIAKLENTTLTRTGLVVGTPSHMAPEQVTGKKVDQRTDVFALGSVFYELVTREKPFRGDVTTVLYKIVHEDPVPPSLVNPALPGGIDAIIRKALAKEPSERFQTCDEMRQAFLEQARLLNLKPVVPAATNSSTATASRPPTHFSLHLLESAPPRRSLPVGPVLAGLVALVVGVGGGRALYPRWRTLSFPALVKTMAGVLHRVAAQSSTDVKPAGDAGQQPAARATDQAAAPQSTYEGSAPAGTSPSSDAAGGNTAQATKSIPAATADSTSPAAQPAITQVSTPPVADGAHAMSVPPSPANGPAHEPQNSPSTSDQPAATTAGSTPEQTNRNRPAAENVNNPPAPSAKEDPSKPDSSADNQTASAYRMAKKPKPQPPLTVDGFTRRDVPALLKEADAAAGRGDYRLARYSYSLILKLEPGNSMARSGLRRVDTSFPPH